jgi:hypothetical protein
VEAPDQQRVATMISVFLSHNLVASRKVFVMAIVLSDSPALIS